MLIGGGLAKAGILCRAQQASRKYRQHGVRIKVARIFNTYGPRMHPQDGRVVSNFIMQALSGEPITLYGTGSQTRGVAPGRRLEPRVAPLPRGYAVRQSKGGVHSECTLVGSH